MINLLFVLKINVETCVEVLENCFQPHQQDMGRGAQALAQKYHCWC